MAAPGCRFLCVPPLLTDYGCLSCAHGRRSRRFQIALLAGPPFLISPAAPEGGRRIAAAAGARALVDLLRLPRAERLVVLLLVARAAAARQAVGRFDRGSPGWAAASVLGCPPSQAPCSSSPCTASLSDSRITSIHSAISIILKHAHSLLQHFFFLFYYAESHRLANHVRAETRKTSRSLKRSRLEEVGQVRRQPRRRRRHAVARGS